MLIGLVSKFVTERLYCKAPSICPRARTGGHDEELQLQRAVETAQGLDSQSIRFRTGTLLRNIFDILRV